MQKRPYSSTDKKMDYWKEEEVLKDEEKNSASQIEGLSDPYGQAMENDWKGMKQYYKKYPQKLICPMTVDEDTALHIAASCCSEKLGEHVLEFLISLLPSYDKKCEALRIQNSHGNNVLHEVAVSGNLEAAKFLVNNFNKPALAEEITTTSTLPLLELRNNLGESPVYRAAALGHPDLVKFFALELEKENPENLRRHFHRNDKKYCSFGFQYAETALWLQKKYPFLATKTEEKGLTSLQLLSQMPTAFEPEFQQSKWKMLIYHCLPVGDLVRPNHKDNDVVKDDVESCLGSDQPPQYICRKTLAQIGIIRRIWKDKRNKNSLEELVGLFVKKDHSWQNSSRAEDKTVDLGAVGENVSNNEGDEKGNGSAVSNKSKKQYLYNYTPLLIATITGIAPIVKEILKQHPQAAEHVSHEEQNILHLAIKHRRKEILKIMKSKPTIKYRLNARIDHKGNSILHQAADRSYYSVAMSQKLIGPAMQLQEDLRWMLRVKKIAPRHYIMHHNKEGQTAEELFNDQHNKLLESAQQWIKDTAASCSTVAVLVATVVFAAAYTIPGGTEPNGLPVYHDSPLFWLFTCMDVLAIACSLSSVAFFLSILSSPLEYPFFCHALPRKLMIGFTLLFLSMAATMLAFAATILLVIRIEKKWTKSLLYSIAFFPVPLFGLLQFPMFQSFKDIYRKLTKIFRPLLGFSKWVCGKD
ncbi:hypothetical protein ACE6H2_012909 [Prunus campanulata]